MREISHTDAVFSPFPQIIFCRGRTHDFVEFLMRVFTPERKAPAMCARSRPLLFRLESDASCSRSRSFRCAFRYRNATDVGLEKAVMRSAIERAQRGDHRRRRRGGQL